MNKLIATKLVRILGGPISFPLTLHTPICVYIASYIIINRLFLRDSKPPLFSADSNHLDTDPPKKWLN